MSPVPPATAPDGLSLSWDVIGTRVLGSGRLHVPASFQPHTAESRFNGLTGDFHGCALRDWTVVFQRKSAMATGVYSGGFDLGHRHRPGVRRADPVEHNRQEMLRRSGRRHATPA